MKTRKLLLTALSMMFVATSAIAFASCDKIGALKGETGDKGDTGAVGLPGQDGADGKTITGVEYDENGDLVFTFSDGTTQTVADPNKHTHAYGEWTKLTGNNCEDGVFSRTCECGEIEWKQGIGHAWGEPTVVDATCTVKGSSTRVCARCEETDVEVLYQDHTFAEGDTAKETCTTCNYVVKGSTGLLFEEKEDGTYAVTGYNGTETKVVIPAVYKNALVTEIATNSFIGTSAADPALIASVSIPSTVTTIGNAAFAYTSLKKIDLPDTITSIGKNAFKGCPNMKTATIGSGLTTIGDTAFNGCTALETVNYNASFVGYRMFYGCSALTTLNLSQATTTIQQEAFRGCTALESIDLTYVTSIPAKGILHTTGVKNVTLPAAITAIPNATFYNSKIESIVMGNVTSVGKQAFLSATEFKTIYYTCAEADYVAPTVGAENDPFNAAKAYFYSETETANGWHYVDGVPTPWTTGTTEPDTPAEPETPVEPEQPDTPVEPETPATPEATVEINGLTLEYSADSKGYIVKSYAGTATDLVFPGEYNGTPVVEIPASMFKGNKTITSVTINGNPKMGKEVFRECTSLVSATINGGTFAGHRIFFNCTSLKTVVLGANWTTEASANQVFEGCTALESVVILSNVTGIGDRAFNKCAALTTVYYAGTKAQFDAVTVVENGNGYFINATKYYYSETAPTTEGNFWHYVEGVVTAWPAYQAPGSDVETPNTGDNSGSSEQAPGSDAETPNTGDNSGSSEQAPGSSEERPGSSEEAPSSDADKTGTRG